MARRSRSTKRSMTPVTIVGSRAKSPEVRKARTASRVAGEQRFRVSRRWASSLGGGGAAAGPERPGVGKGSEGFTAWVVVGAVT